ncbi:alpha/beta hydrolase [Sphingomonas sp. QA11]|uniref:alpha/beta fold hydrolase n=1 Tax=Sphingomonas sp. QA11 TaxID=2950605 RepID=UPI00234A0345|nr:alpha/beta hydrolase [Sphingomonas sp. QA11]WCM28613.1 alpha/beta hydrolase [Sphingomonas sp. QA11]
MPPIRIHGHGPSRIIAIHGWFNDSAAFDGMLPGFDPDRFSIALPDLRGYGPRRSSSGPFNMATAAADMLAVADQLGWTRFSVIGHSMGGKAALALAVAAPERVERVIGITPVWAGPAPFDPPTLGFFRAAAGDVGTRQAILDTTTGERLPSAWLRANAERSMEISDRDAFAAYLESWAGDDFAEAASGVERPVLVIAGAHDRGVPEEVLRATWLAALAHAELAVLPEAGHYPMDESPLTLAARIIAFIDPDIPR